MWTANRAELPQQAIDFDRRDPVWRTSDRRVIDEGAEAVGRQPAQRTENERR
jgi:hypothetical protein